MTKTCRICGEMKEETEFPWSNKSKGKTRPQCRICWNVLHKEWKSKTDYNRKMYQRNRPKRIANAKKWNADPKNKERREANQKRFLEKAKQNPNYWKDKYQNDISKYEDRIIAYRIKWRNENKDYVNKYNREYTKERSKKDPLYRFQKNMRRRVTLAFTGKCKSKHTLELVGCSWEKLRTHISNQFRDGMAWENYGLHGWHVDHIIPLSSARTEEELIKLCHYTNLQPLWAAENIAKSDKISA